MVQPKNRRLATESYTDTAKADAIADANTKYGGLPTRVTTLESRTVPPTLGGTVNLNTVQDTTRRKTVTSSIAGDTSLGYPPGAVHGYVDAITMGTNYVWQQWTDTWGDWKASRRLYDGSWTSWVRHGAAEVAEVESRVTALEKATSEDHPIVITQRTVDVASDFRPDVFASPEGTITYWTGPNGTERIGWGYRGEGYVGRIATAAGYTTMQAKKVQSNNEIEVSCLNPVAGRHVTYRIQGTGTSSQDDQRRIEETWVGTYAGTTVSKDLLIMPRSNIEWAFQIDVAGNKQFAPYHGSASALAVEYGPATVADASGATLNLDDLAVDGVISNLNGLKIRQRLYLTHPDSGATKWAAVDEVHTIAPDGMLQTEAVITFFQDMTIGSNYGPMTPVDQSTFGSMKVLNGTTYPVKTSPPATTEYLTITEGHAATSALFTSTTRPDAFVAVTYLDRTATFMVGNALEETSSLALRLEQRSSAGLTKLYPTVFTPGSVIPSGTEWRVGAQWRYGETTNPQQYA